MIKRFNNRCKIADTLYLKFRKKNLAHGGYVQPFIMGVGKRAVVKVESIYIYISCQLHPHIQKPLRERPLCPNFEKIGESTTLIII